MKLKRFGYLAAGLVLGITLSGPVAHAAEAVLNVVPKMLGVLRVVLLVDASKECLWCVVEHYKVSISLAKVGGIEHRLLIRHALRAIATILEHAAEACEKL